MLYMSSNFMCALTISQKCTSFTYIKLFYCIPFQDIQIKSSINLSGGLWSPRGSLNLSLLTRGQLSCCFFCWNCVRLHVKISGIMIKSRVQGLYIIQMMNTLLLSIICIVSQLGLYQVEARMHVFSHIVNSLFWLAL